MDFQSENDALALGFLKEEIDSGTEKILKILYDVSIYKINSEKNKWEKKFGNFFLYSRSMGPKYGFCVLDKLKHMNDLSEVITGNLEVEDDGTPFLTFRSAKNGAYKMWFFLEEDRKEFASYINELIKTACLSEAGNKVLKVEESNQIGIGTPSSDFTAQMKQPLLAGNFQQVSGITNMIMTEREAGKQKKVKRFKSD